MSELIPDFAEERERLLRLANKECTRAEKIWKALKKNAEEANQYEEKVHTLDLMRTHFTEIKRGADSMVVEDWNSSEKMIIPLNPKLSPKDNMNLLAKIVKRLKAARIYTTANLPRAEKAYIAACERRDKIAAAASIDELNAALIGSREVVKKQAAAQVKPERKTHPFHEFITSGGAKIYAGKRADQNDDLTCHFANGNDTWLHVSQCPGSHVIIRTPDGSAPDPEALHDAMQVAIRYSKGRERVENEVVVTLKKNVSKPKGAKAGLVMTRDAKIYYVKTDRARFESLLRA